MSDTAAVSRIHREIVVESAIMGDVPLIELDYTAGDRGACVTIRGADAKPSAVFWLDDGDIRALHRELAAIIWYWGDVIEEPT